MAYWDSIQLPPVAVEFFTAFARFEFALKRGDFLAGEVGENAEPHWDKFAKALGDDFFKAMAEAAPARVFFREPPRRLKVVANGQPDFKDAEVPRNAADLFLAIRRVRNNLFHGEKFWFRERDNELIRASLFVLDAAYKAASGKAGCERLLGAFVWAPITPA